MLLEDLQVVLKVAEFRNITAAAAHLDMRTSTASAGERPVDAESGRSEIWNDLLSFLGTAQSASLARIPNTHNESSCGFNAGFFTNSKQSS